MQPRNGFDHSFAMLANFDQKSYASAASHLVTGAVLDFLRAHLAIANCTLDPEREYVSALNR